LDVKVSDAVVALQFMTITDSDPAVVKGGRLVNHHHLMTYGVVIDSISLTDVRAADRADCKGLSVNLSGEVGEFGPVSHDGGLRCVLRLLRLLDQRCFWVDLGQPQQYAQFCPALSNFGGKGGNRV
jgi:hypothetical protein